MTVLRSAQTTGSPPASTGPPAGRKVDWSPAGVDRVWVVRGGTELCSFEVVRPRDS
ncbi:hypothetical protein [Actinoplanes sp. NPDC048796]|uniref:hypothetical protein n=1 Tax=unclassified Actinoplanes TaxID=2626549 RepID=UPI0034037D96